MSEPVKLNLATVQVREDGVLEEHYELLDMDTNGEWKRLTPTMHTPQITFDENTGHITVYRCI